MRIALVLAATATPVLAEPADTLPHLTISIQARRLWVLAPAGDTLFTAPVAVGSGRTFRTSGRTWVFSTPRGESVVGSKEVAPVWIPPDWHYLEVARKLGLHTEQLTHDVPVPLGDGRLLMVRNGIVGVLGADSLFRTLPEDEEIIFGTRLFIPPFGTSNRRVEGALGPYRLLLANGVGLHGTPYKESIGTAATHGCIRLHDEDITWLYENVPVGSRVTIY
jgi:lipoprotein-anchoring transpeptidase ErfK/SrfK